MRNQLVYDLPMRFFHWTFAGLFVTAFFIAKVIGDDSPLFSYHMLAGILLVLTVGLRILWGFFGTQHSRFSSFALRPQELVAYFTGLLSGDRRKWAGHNPASSWASLTMFGLAIGLGLTGYLMSTGSKESFEDVHELMANGFLLVVLLHIAGVVLHGFRHQDGIVFSMIDGNKSAVPTASVIPNSRPLIAGAFVVLVLGFANHLFKNYDSGQGTLNLFGQTLTLGENENQERGSDQQEQEESEGEGHERERSEDHDGD